MSELILVENTVTNVVKVDDTNIILIMAAEQGPIGLTGATGSAGTNNHLLLSNIGVQSHVQIDSHIADGTIHFTQGSISIAESQVVNLVTDLAGKSSISHNHSGVYEPANANIQSHISDTSIHFTQGSISIAESQVVNLVTDLAGKAAVSHVHAESDITGLVTDLSNKSDVSHNHSGVYEPANANIQSHISDTTLHIPSQTGNNGKFLTTNGTSSSWSVIPGGLTEAQSTQIAIAMAIALS